MRIKFYKDSIVTRLIKYVDSELCFVFEKNLDKQNRKVSFFIILHTEVSKNLEVNLYIWYN